MPAIWSSSERPISVRTVWVDGVRHAILSQDDPLLNVKASRRRPQSTSTIKDKNYPIKFEPYKPATPPENCSFDGCFVKVRLVVEKSNNSPDSAESSARGIVRRQSAPVCSRLIRRAFNFCANESFERDTGEDFSLLREVAEDEKIFEMTFNLEEEVKRAETPQLTTLSERVIQWLDLSGKVRDYECEEPQSSFNDSVTEKTTNTTTRRKFSNFKEERPTSLKILVPTQYLMLREKHDDAVTDEICEKRFRKGKASSKKQHLDLHKNEEIYNVQSQDESEKISARSQSLWTPPSKPQLHIFMPSLKPNDVYWTSSQESLICE